MSDSTVVLTILIKQHAMNWIGGLVVVTIVVAFLAYITYRNTPTP